MNQWYVWMSKAVRADLVYPVGSDKHQNNSKKLQCDVKAKANHH